MAVRTISLKTEAYERLKAARRYPAESFSEVVLRATWPEDTVTGRAACWHCCEASPAVVHRPRNWTPSRPSSSGDTPPEDKWAGR